MFNMKKIKGAASVGDWRAPYLCSTIEIIENRLILNASIFGYFVFDKEDIISLESYEDSFVKGIKINHKVESYYDDIYFFPLGGTNIIIGEIENIMKNNECNEKVDAEFKKYSGRVVIKKPVIVLIILLLVYSFKNDVIFVNFEDLFRYKILNYKIGVPQISILFIIVLFSLLFVSKKVRSIILIKNYNFEYLKPFIYFMFILMFLGLSSDGFFN